MADAGRPDAAVFTLGTPAGRVHGIPALLPDHQRVGLQTRATKPPVELAQHLLEV